MKLSKGDNNPLQSYKQLHPKGSKKLDNSDNATFTLRNWTWLTRFQYPDSWQENPLKFKRFLRVYWTEGFIHSGALRFYTYVLTRIHGDCDNLNLPRFFLFVSILGELVMTSLLTKIVMRKGSSFKYL